ncbi:MAG: ribonuclease HII [Spirochaetota bacterium]
MQLSFSNEESKYTSQNTVFGVDEAGRGPLAGPLSLAAVSFSPEIISKVLQQELLLGIDDSKKLSEKKRERLFDEIHQHAAQVQHRFVSNKFIDKFGISYAIYTGISSIHKKLMPLQPYLLVDGNYKFEKWHPGEQTKFAYTSIVRGDSHVVSIAAASIIAKVTRDRYMQRFAQKYPEYGFEKHKGYGTKLHREKIGKHGYCSLHRRTFYLKS